MISNWASQSHIDFVPVLDFSAYDSVLDMSIRLGVIPTRFSHLSGWDQYFAMSRGTENGMACEMKKWFDTNYHYIVPELSSQSVFKVSPFGFDTISHAQKAITTHALPVFIGPMTFLYLSKSIDHSNKWNLIDLLTEAYINLIRLMPDSEWIQLDEPIFSLELSDELEPLFDHIQLNPRRQQYPYSFDSQLRIYSQVFLRLARTRLLLRFYQFDLNRHHSPVLYVSK